MNNQLQSVVFYQDSIFLVEHNSEPFVPVKPICENIGLDWKSQYEKIKSNFEVFIYGLITTVAEDGKSREMVCLPLKKIHGWLMTVSPSKIMPAIKEKLIQYQVESIEVLWNYWTKGVALPDRLAVEYVAVRKDELIELQRDRVLYLERQVNPAGGPVTLAEITKFKQDILSGMGTSKVAKKYLRSSSTIKRYTVEERKRLRLNLDVASGLKQMPLFGREV